MTAPPIGHAPHTPAQPQPHEDPPREAVTARYLLCPPTWYRIEHQLNAWMDPRRPVDRVRAIAQWQRLHAALTELGHQIDLLEPLPHLPDQVFTRDPVIMCPGRRVLAARFRYRERAGETAPLLAWLAHHGYRDVITPGSWLEGGDVLDAGPAGILLGYGFRSERTAAADLRAATGRPVTPLRLIDPRWYHLDTAISIINEHLVAYYPGAFHPADRAIIEQLWPDAIRADAADALAFGLNIISDGRAVIMPTGADRLAEGLRQRGIGVITIDTSEFAAAGGGPRCCTLALPVSLPAARPATGPGSGEDPVTTPLRRSASGGQSRRTPETPKSDTPSTAA